MGGRKDEEREGERKDKGGRDTHTQKKEVVVGNRGHSQIYAHTHTHTKLCIMNILLARLDERLIEVEDILWQRDREQEKRRGKRMRRGGSDDEHGAGERRGR